MRGRKERRRGGERYRSIEDISNKGTERRESDGIGWDSRETMEIWGKVVKGVGMEIF